MSFIENAKKIKKEKGYTTNELSKMCGIPLGTLSKLFSGIIEEPKLSAAISISKALDTTVDSLCGINEGTYTNEERELIQRFRKLDEHGKKLTELIIKNETARLEATMSNDQTEKSVTSEKEEKTDPVTKKKEEQESPSKEEQPIVQNAEFSIRTLPLFSNPFAAINENTPADNEASTIRVKNTGKVAEASFALRVVGESMLPDYSEGDILIIKRQSSVLEGEFGIFICDNNAYFKKFNSDRLTSLNPAYPDLMISDFNSFSCLGLVLGRLKSKKN